MHFRRDFKNHSVVFSSKGLTQNNDGKDANSAMNKLVYLFVCGSLDELHYILEFVISFLNFFSREVSLSPDLSNNTSRENSIQKVPYMLPIAGH